MRRHENPSAEAKRILVNSCAGFAKLLARRQISLDDYLSNITTDIAGNPEEYWEDCLDTIPVEHHEGLINYLNEQVRDKKFKPFPRMFIIGTETHAEIRDIQAQMKPYYVKFYDMVLRRFPKPQPGG